MYNENRVWDSLSQEVGEVFLASWARSLNGLLVHAFPSSRQENLVWLPSEVEQKTKFTPKVDPWAWQDLHAPPKPVFAPKPAPLEASGWFDIDEPPWPLVLFKQLAGRQV